MFTFDIVYIVLYLSVCCVFYQCGRFVSKGGNYYLFAAFCLTGFTFVIGSRYGRGPDYLGYIYTYVLNIEKFGNRGFTYFNQLLHTWNVDSYHIFYYYAFVSMTGALIFLKKYSTYAIYLFPAFYLATFNLLENPVRQMLGYAFVFLYLSQLFQIQSDSIKSLISIKNGYHLFWGFLSIYVALSIHTACLIDITLLTFLYFFVKFPVPLKLSIPLVVLSSYVIPKIYDVGFIAPFLNILGAQNEMFSGYVEGNWFSSDAASTDVAENPIVKLLEVLGNIALLYFGMKVIKSKEYHRDSISMYNCFFIGTCIVMAFKLIEIPARVGGFLRLYWFYPFALVLFYRKQIIKTTWERLLSYCLVFWIYAFVKYLLINEGKTLFLWDIGRF